MLYVHLSVQVYTTHQFLFCVYVFVLILPYLFYPYVFLFNHLFLQCYNNLKGDFFFFKWRCVINTSMLYNNVLSFLEVGEPFVGKDQSH